MFDEILEDDLWLQEREEMAEKRGEMRGEMRGELLGIQKSIISVVQIRFPNLVELARQKIILVTQKEKLQLLQVELITALDETQTFFVLDKIN